MRVQVGGCMRVGVHMQEETGVLAKRIQPSNDAGSMFTRGGEAIVSVFFQCNKLL